MCPQNQFFRFKSDIWVFLKRKHDSCIRYPIFHKGYIYFCRPMPYSLKIAMPAKNNFSQLFWKILFFSKKLLNKKYIKLQCLQKRFVATSFNPYVYVPKYDSSDALLAPEIFKFHPPLRNTRQSEFLSDK